MEESIARFIEENRIKSFEGETSIKTRILDETGFQEIYFNNGEIDSVALQDGKKLKRGMVVRVSSRYTGSGVAVIIGFNVDSSKLPIIISMGGAEGELNASVHPKEITLFPTQREMDYKGVIKLQAIEPVR